MNEAHEKAGKAAKRTAKKTGTPLAALMLGVSLAVSGCGSSGTASETERLDAVEVDTRLVTGYNQFGFDLLRHTVAAKPQTNTLLSPASIAIALSMTMNGAAGPTREEMARTLGLDGLRAEEINNGAQTLIGAFEKLDPDAKLSIANSIWARKGMKFEAEFLTLNKSHFSARVEALDFSSSKTPKTINKWVSKQTNGLIPEIVDELDAQAIMVLLNAVYFKGNWSEPFKTEATRELPFTLENGTSVQRSMMKRTDTFAYAERSGYSAIRLPYGDRSFGMIALLPQEGQQLQNLIGQLNTAEWEELNRAFASRRGELLMPRIQLAYSASLKEPLQQLGMKLAFDDAQADFSKLLTPPPVSYISSVAHKSFIRVDEKGTEAAAVTEIGMAGGAAPSAPDFRFALDRPFLIAVHEQQTGIVLFVGAVYDPGGEGK